MTKIAIICAAALASQVVAQDPAPGWMAYAVGTSPSGKGVITRAEAKWVVGGTPTNGGSAFYSPWLGIEASDNLNLIQTVNPWLGDGWSMYNEYFQWSPENNIDSDSNNVSPGDILHGVMTFNAANQSYTMTHTDVTTGWSVTTVIPVQKTRAGAYKNYTIVYIVYEKVNQCDSYPPEGQVTFYDVFVEYDGVRVAPNWQTGVVDANCDMTAHILNSTSVQITWDASGGGGGGSTTTAQEVVTKL